MTRTDNAALRVLILGAGQAGEALVRDLRRAGAYQPVGFLDDAAKLRGSHLQGVPVLGRVDEVERIAPETAAKLLVIAMPSLDAASMRRIVAACESTGLPFRTVPRLDDLLEGRSLPGELKEVAIEDLLGRQPVMPDWKAIRGWLGGRSVLVTGAGGSIGSELCRQCARHGARQITLVEIDELALTTIEAGTAARFSADSLHSGAWRLRRPGGDAIRAANCRRRKPCSMPRPTSRCRCWKRSCAKRSATTCWRRETVAHACQQSRCRHVRADFDRQGRGSGQRARREQAPGRNGLPGDGQCAR